MKKFLRSPILSVVVFVAAAALLIVGTVGTVRAAKVTPSKDYLAQIELDSINVAIVENETTLEDDGELLTNLTGGKKFKIGQKYDEVLKVENSGEYDEYVRVTVNWYWTDADGNKLELDPSMIILNFPEGNGWTIDEEASTAESAVLYYDKIVAPGERTEAFADSLTIDRAVSTFIDADENYIYDGAVFQIDVVADAVQTHNGEDAMTYVWGRTNNGGEASK